MSSNVVSFGRLVEPLEPSVDPRRAQIAQAAIGPTRVQLRMALDELDQTERDLTLMRDAMDRCLATVQRARKARNLAALSEVRATLEGTNRMLNAKRHGR